jgi:exopolysaccharide production protein ExoZ
LINNIQLLRAFAALSVVVFHTDFNFRAGVHTEFQGVPIFFIISGFIMTHISRGDPAGFFFNRCVRIVPLYFLLTALLFFWKLKALLPFEIFHYLAHNDGVNTGLTLETFLKSLLFVPYLNAAGDWQPINGVGWTLNLEMYFYILYALALRLSTRFAPLMVGAAVLAVNGFGGAGSGLFAFYAQNCTVYFVLGIVIYYLWQAAIPWLENRVPVLALQCAGGGVIAFFFSWHLSPELVALFSQFAIDAINYLLPFLIVTTALFFHSKHISSNWKPILIVGEASYALYLSHVLVIGQVRVMGYAVNAHSGLGMLLMVVAVSALIAVILHYQVERPITRYLRFRRGRQM